MQSKVNKLLATTTMLVAMGLFAAMSPAWAQNTGQQNQTPQQQQQQQMPNAQQQQPGQQGQQPAAQPGQNAEPGQAAPGQEAQQSQQAGQNGEITATGCIQSTGGGQYSLTDQATNQTYTLTSSTEDLAKHVGQTVKITGTPSNAGAAGTPAGQAGQEQTLNVTKVKKVSSSCSGGATGQPPSIL